jgi:hypothetical protein
LSGLLILELEEQTTDGLEGIHAWFTHSTESESEVTTTEGGRQDQESPELAEESLWLHLKAQIFSWYLSLVANTKDIKGRVLKYLNTPFFGPYYFFAGFRARCPDLERCCPWHSGHNSQWHGLLLSVPPSLPGKLGMLCVLALPPSRGL